MTTPIKELRGITDAMVETLKGNGIDNNEEFVEAAATPAQRKELATLLSCDAKDVLGLANRADLARIKGVSGAYSDLLEQAGVDTVKELATRRPDNLHAKLTETNDAKQLTKRPPAASMVEDWVDQAKALPKILTY